MAIDAEKTFPADWTEWDSQWHAWLDAHKLPRSGKRIPGRNMLADEVLGTFRMNGHAVELSAVTFPNLSERDENGHLISETHRYVGISWYGEGGRSINGGLVNTFADLDELLVAGPPA